MVPKFYYESDSPGWGYSIWQVGGTLVEDKREVDTHLFNVVDKVDAQTACEILNNLWSSPE